MSNRWWLALAAAGILALTASAQDKDSFTPMPLDAGFGKLDLSEPTTPPDEIIKKFAAKESEFQEALNHYTYRRLARVQTIDDDTHKVDGEWYQVDDVTFDPTGRRMEKTVFAPESSLQRVMMSPSDLQDIQKGYPFVLTTEEIAQYNIKVRGAAEGRRGRLLRLRRGAEADCKEQALLSGRIWVDATDLQIVVTNGRMVPDDTRKNNEDLHPPFMTWRAAGRWALLVPGVYEGRGRAALSRRERLHVAGRAHARHHQIHGLQAVWIDDQADLRRAGYYADRTTAGTAGEAGTTREAAGAA